MSTKFLKWVLSAALFLGFISPLLSIDLSPLNEIPISDQGRIRPAGAAIPFTSDPFIRQRPIPSNQAVEAAVLQLTRTHTPPKQIDLQIEAAYPLAERLQNVDSAWIALPSYSDPSHWHSLKALELTTYHLESNRLLPIANFTAYPDETFHQIREAYVQLEKALLSDVDQGEATQLANRLLQAYQHLYDTRSDLHSVFPSMMQLKTESFYHRFPSTPLALAGYLLAALLFLIDRYHPKSWIRKGGWIAHLTAFLVQTCCLALRCYILGRPPVSNMFETLLFVPWTAVLSSYLLYIFIRTEMVLAASALSASTLLILLQWSGIEHSLENVQPVLNSHYWLIIHVLMVVGSYGVFVLGGLLAHLYLIFFHYQRHSHLELIGKLIIQSMFLGTALLIPGTLLGGVWAAQSWGRFWDWDPKESWAFISSCTYLIWIHAYVFKKIHYFGAAIGAIVGLMMIGFTWYGVNYILGTGLHSYGFGEGGAFYFLLYIAGELFFLAFFTRSRYNKRPSMRNESAIRKIADSDF